MRLEGKVALISGGSRGQGAREAILFAREGAKIVLGDILEDLGAQVEAEINESGGEAMFIRLDVTREADWESAVAETVRRFGRLDILVNNAAVLSGEPVEHVTVEEWDRVMDINLKGVVLGMKHSIPAIRESGGGSIVNISSTAGLSRQRPWERIRRIEGRREDASPSSRPFSTRQRA